MERRNEIRSKSKNPPKDTLTIEVFERLKMELKNEILLGVKRLLQEHHPYSGKKWLKTSEVEKLLDLSPGTLQTLRANGTLPHTKLGGTLYYNKEDINKELEKRKKVGGRSNQSFSR
jgi:hypothetical protein